MLAIAWKDIRRHIWVTALMVLLAFVALAVTRSTQNPQWFAMGVLLAVVPLAASLIGALTFADECGQQSQHFLRTLPVGTLRVWLGKTVASLCQAIVLGAALLLPWLKVMGNWALIPALLLFWAWGLFFSTVFRRTAVAALVTVYIVANMIYSFTPAHFLFGILSHVFLPSKWAFLNARDTLLLAAACVAVPLAGSLVGCLLWRRGRAGGNTRACLFLVCGLVLLGATYAITLNAFARSFSPKSMIVDRLLSDGDGAVYLSDRSSHWDGRAQAIINAQGASSWRIIPFAGLSGLPVSPLTDGRRLAFAQVLDASARPNLLAGAAKALFSSLGLRSLGNPSPNERVRPSWREDPISRRLRDVKPVLLDLSDGTSHMLDGLDSMQQNLDLIWKPAGWTNDARFLVLVQKDLLQRPPKARRLRVYNSDGTLLEERVPDGDWQLGMPESVLVKDNQVYLFQQFGGTFGLQGPSDTVVQSLWDLDHDTFIERTCKRAQGEICYTRDFACRFTIEPEDHPLYLNRRLGWSHQNAAEIGAPIVIDQDKRNRRTVCVYGTSVETGRKTLLAQLDENEDRMSVSWRPTRNGSELFVLVLKYQYGKEALERRRAGIALAAECTAGKLIRFDLKTGDLAATDVSEESRWLMASPDENRIVVGGEHRDWFKSHGRSWRRFTPVLRVYDAQKLSLVSESPPLENAWSANPMFDAPPMEWIDARTAGLPLFHGFVKVDIQTGATEVVRLSTVLDRRRR